MNLNTRLSAVQRERGRRCSACGGPIVPLASARTWQAVIDDYCNLPDEEKIAFAAHNNLMDKLPPRHQELAHKMYCQQQGIPYEHQGAVYSSPNPPPAPWFPDTDPQSAGS